MRRILLSFVLAGLAIASAKSYKVKLFEPAMVGTTLLKPGEYQVEVVDQKAVIRNGKIESQAAVKVETGDTKYDATTVQYSNGDGKMHVREIHLGGTKTRLVFSE
jgi:hypothetical protein